jgi:hypothetical protein
MSDLELEKKNKLRDMFDGGSGKGGVSKEIRDQITEQRQWLEQKREIMKLREVKDGQIADLLKEKDKLVKLCHPTYNRTEDLEKGVKILSKRIETSTITPK